MSIFSSIKPIDINCKSTGGISIDSPKKQLEAYVKQLQERSSPDAIQLTDEGVVVDTDEISSKEYKDLKRYCKACGVIVWENWNKG